MEWLHFRMITISIVYSYQIEFFFLICEVAKYIITPTISNISDRQFCQLTKCQFSNTTPFK